MRILLRVIVKCAVLKVAVLLTFVSSCDAPKKRFSSISPSSSNIDFINSLDPTPDLNILSYLYYYNGGGIAAADFNNDGLIDLFFTGNEVADRLYLNKGDLVFEDVTQIAGFESDRGWSTGATHVDINQDGWMDIYVCKVGNYKSMQGRNLLFVNQGLDEAGVPTFTESAKKYGLDFSGFSTQATFFDYDLDGDLDMYLLNHSVHPNRSYGIGTKRTQVDSLSGDRLYRNEEGQFVDVSVESGIFQGSIGYGLGASVGDINDDGFPDLYIGNDFFENDYLYLNQGDETFKDVISSDPSKLGHTTHYSMGNSLADLNNDAMPDIVSLDMLPENIQTYKTSGNEYPYPIYRYYLKNGYAPQYMQNTLHMNHGNGTFGDVAFLSGIAATEWSWGVLTADLDMDGHKDLYISNGIVGATNDMDFISFIAQERVQKKLEKGMDEEDMEFIDQLPTKKVTNYAFRNTGELSYENVSQSWFDDKPTFSNGCVYADLDNDGDLDVVVNNINGPASLYENHTNEEAKSYLKLSFEGPPGNRSGIGVKVKLFMDGQIILEENFPNKSYLSAVPPELTIGAGASTAIDSMKVIWPGGAYQLLKEVDTRQHLKISYQNALGDAYARKSGVDQFLVNVAAPVDFVHQEEPCLEFEREPLIPFAKSNEGPGVSIADVNDDGFEDIFIGGAKRQAGALFIQMEDGSFVSSQGSLFKQHAINEDTDHLFLDVEGDGDEDLIVVSGGNEFRGGEPLQPRLYRNVDGIFVLDSITFKGVEVNASVVKSIDLENDGDRDLLIGSDAVPWNFGKSTTNYVFENVDGAFEDVSSGYSLFQKAGLIEDFDVIDLNDDGYEDVIIAGYWIPITVLFSDGNGLELAATGLEKSEGWWNTIVSDDFDQDGDIDLVAGNWGLNSRLSASISNPITLYRNDFDANGTVEPIITYYYQGVETLLPSKDEVVKQLPHLNKKYLSYKSFATAGLSDLFSSDKLKEADQKQVSELASCYFENMGDNTFEVHALPSIAQLSSIHAVQVEDFNHDGFSDLLLVGNSHQISTQLGRLDASHGTLLLNNKKGFFEVGKSTSFDISGQARDIGKMEIDGEIHYVVTINNEKPIFLKSVRK